MRFLLRRLTSAVLVLWLVMSGVFVLVNVVGDPAAAALGLTTTATGATLTGTCSGTLSRRMAGGGPFSCAAGG